MYLYVEVHYEIIQPTKFEYSILGVKSRRISM
jgi:hypothetical protein